jgi:branched-chain amino acid transport system substrate-binding protein
MSSPDSPAPTSQEGVVLRVVGSLTGPDAETDAPYLDGIRLAEVVVNRRGGVDGTPIELRTSDDRSDPAATEDLLREAVADRAAVAVLVVGAGRALVAARPEIEGSRIPVILLRGDLYSGQDLFRLAFQTSLPYRWQAAVMARYLVKDRRYDRVVQVTERGPGAELARDAFQAAMAEEGSAPALRLPIFPASDVAALARRSDGADAVVYFGGPRGGRRLARAVSRLADPPQFAASSDALQAGFAEPAQVAPGTVAPYPYTWAGWAEPIRRVATFRALCRRELGHPPLGFEQEGYDAVRLVAEALERTEGQGGDRLVRALESSEEPVFSSLPIGLGPDDHLLLTDRQLGLFAVARPTEDAEPWAPSWAPWRPVMRTFTGNGERTTVIDRDKDVFFPGWHAREPAPDFWTARYGIVTRRRDPLH